MVLEVLPHSPPATTLCFPFSVPMLTGLMQYRRVCVKYLGMDIYSSLHSFEKQNELGRTDR